MAVAVEGLHAHAKVVVTLRRPHAEDAIFAQRLYTHLLPNQTSAQCVGSELSVSEGRGSEKSTRDRSLLVAWSWYARLGE